MLYTIQEAAKKLNVSKQSIYNKLKLPEFNGMVLVKQGKSMLDEDTVNLLSKSLKLKTKLTDSFTDDTNTMHKEATESQQNQSNVEASQANLKLNQAMLNALTEQLKEKDKQIVSLNEILAVMTENIAELIKSNQHSQLTIQEKDSKLQELLLLDQEKPEQMQEETIPVKNDEPEEVFDLTPKKKGFFQRIFKK
jgi:hypothetical protein